MLSSYFEDGPINFFIIPILLVLRYFTQNVNKKLLMVNIYIKNLFALITNAAQQYLYREEYGLFLPSVHQKHFSPKHGRSSIYIKSRGELCPQVLPLYFLF